MDLILDTFDFRISDYSSNHTGSDKTVLITNPDEFSLAGCTKIHYGVYLLNIEGKTLWDHLVETHPKNAINGKHLISYSDGYTIQIIAKLLSNERGLIIFETTSTLKDLNRIANSLKILLFSPFNMNLGNFLNKHIPYCDKVLKIGDCFYLLTIDGIKKFSSETGLYLAMVRHVDIINNTLKSHPLDDIRTIQMPMTSMAKFQTYIQTLSIEGLRDLCGELRMEHPNDKMLSVFDIWGFMNENLDCVVYVK